MSQRIQLNVHGQNHKIDMPRFLETLQLAQGSEQWIFQLDGVNDSLLTWAIENGVNAVGLFDKSGGTGVLPSEWPQPSFKAESYGYAGGLGQENIEEQLQNIWTALFVSDGDGKLWIDAESKLRDSQDGFSIPKCLQFLDKCKPYVKGL